MKQLNNLFEALLLIALPMVLTGCEDLFGEWDRPTPVNPTPTPTPTPEPEVFDPVSTPLTFEAAEDGEIKVTYNWGVVLSQPIKYSLNGIEQTDITAETSTPIDANHKATTITVNAGDIVQFWSNNSALANDNGGKYLSIIPTAKCYIYGNFMSMIDDGTEGFAKDKTISVDWALSRLECEASNIYNHPQKTFVLPATTLTKGCYFDMFDQCINITSIPEDLLPAGKDGVGSLAEQCYRQMFIISGLKSIPEKLLPATTLTKQCYNCMFADCISLTSIPANLLPAGKDGVGSLAENCYDTMFTGCTGLTSLPANLLPAMTLKKECYKQMFMDITVVSLPAGLLPATTLAEGCYNSMFRYADIVDVAYSLLPATTLAKSCYFEMFADCSKLLTSPKLGAATLVGGCYERMFQQCKKLGSVTCLATSGFGTGVFDGWLSGAGSSASTRTLHVKTSDSHSTTDWGMPTSDPLWSLSKDQP